MNLARNIFHCFSCDAGGTVLDFVAAMEGCSLFEAARRIQAITCSPCSPDLSRSAPNGKELVTERRKVSSASELHSDEHRLLASLSRRPWDRGKNGR